MRTVKTDGYEFSVEDGLRGSGGIPKPERMLASEAEVEGRLLVHRKELDLSRHVSSSVSLRSETDGFKVVEVRS
jgi:hypothetical protein